MTQKSPPTLQSVSNHGMSPEATEFFVASQLQHNGVWQELPDIITKSSWHAQVFDQRLKSVGLEISGDLFILILILSMGNPGKLVSWTWTLAHMAVKAKTVRLTVNHWTADYGLGVPDDAEYERVWDAQKCSGILGNALDKPQTWAHLLPLF